MMNKSEIVSKYLENLIISEQLKPGDKIPSETKLAEELGVSRVSVRSGIAKLNAMGLLDKKKGGGTYVNAFQTNHYLSKFLPIMSFDTINYVEMLEVRSALDSLSVELCIKNLNEDLIKRFEENLSKMKEEINSTTFYELDKEFHLIISKGSNNSLIHSINTLIWNVLDNHAREQYHLLDNNQRMIEHQLIYNMIVNKDIELAKIYCDRHLKRTITDVKEVL
jgi:GntR family transcriptional regulator, transcriptional repressor for pyruvate dehydrogenase complex